MPAEEGVSERVVVVVSGGEPLDPHAALAVPAGLLKAAADGAPRLIHQCGRRYDAPSVTGSSEQPG